MLYAAHKILPLAWRGVPMRRGGKVPGGIEPQDLALEAITLALDGTRHWNQKVDATFEEFLRGIVDSRVSARVNSIENRNARRMPEPREPADRESAAVVERAASDPTPDDVVASAEARGRIHELICAALKDDAEALAILECLQAEIVMPADIASCLGLEVATVNRAKRRLARAAARVFAKQEGRPS